MNLYYPFKAYIKIVHDTLLLRRRYVRGIEHLPAEGERFIIVCNHQNTGNDPLNILFAMPFRRRMCAMARANLFEIKPWITDFLHWVGMVPAFRFGWEGAEGLSNNQNSFSQVSARLNEGYPFVIFPEAGHTQGQYINRFTSGTVRIAFQAAADNGWKEDIKILPTADHYSNYFEAQIEYMWMLAEPISLRPYYEEFQQHPNSVMRRITHQLHDIVQSMMLDEGEEDYEVKDFLRLSAFNLPDRDRLALPERLDKDKSFIKHLREHDSYAEIIALADELRQAEAALGITDDVVAARPGLVACLLRSLLMLALFPIWVILLWPHLLSYALPLLMLKTDRMFTNTYRYVFATLFIYPICALITLGVLGSGMGHWWLAFIWCLLWMPTGRLAWRYYVCLRHHLCTVRYQLHRRKMSGIHAMRSRLALLLK